MTAPSPTPGARWRREDLPEDLAELVATLEPNPTYVAAIDGAGHRLRFEETTVFTLAASLAGIF